MALAGFVERLEVLAHLRRQLLALALGHLSARGARHALHRRIERAFGHLLTDPLAQTVRVFVRRQIELAIQRKQAAFTRRTVTLASDHHLTEQAHQTALTALSTLGTHHAIATRDLLPLGLA